MNNGNSRRHVPKQRKDLTKEKFQLRSQSFSYYHSGTKKLKPEASENHWLEICTLYQYLIPGRDKGFFSTPKLPKTPLAPPRLLFREYWWLCTRANGDRSVKPIINLHLLPRFRIVDLYLHSPTCLQTCTVTTSLLSQRGWFHEMLTSYLISVETSELANTLPINDLNNIINYDIQINHSALQEDLTV
jgi:hypothetical protein